MSERERELQLARREAFCQGAAYAGFSGTIHGDTLEGIAKRKYPITVTRPRVIDDGSGYHWRVMDGRIEFRHERAVPDVGWGPLTARADVLRDLLANPTEEVTE